MSSFQISNISQQTMKKPKFSQRQQQDQFDLLSEELILTILDFLDDPFDRKSLSLVCKSLYTIESHHRKALKPLRAEHLPKVLNRYPHVSHLDLSLCPRVTDNLLGMISNASCGSRLKRVNLSRSKFFSSVGLLSLAVKCSNLVELDLSNATELRDAGAKVVAEAKNLESLWLGRCKLVSDMGIGCIAVGCRKLRLLCLKWCVGIGDLGVELVAVKCKELRSLDISYLPITDKCLPSILKLTHLQELILEGCFSIDDRNLAALQHDCKSLKTLDLSSCQNIAHAGLSSLTCGADSLQHLILAHGSYVTLDLAKCLQKLSTLQTIKLDGCSVTCSGLKAIGDCCASLKELSLSKCPGVTDDGLSYLVNKHGDLKKLDITCCRRISYASILHITKSSTALTSLKMESCSLVCKEAFILIGQHCHSLEELDLTDNEIDDAGLKSISRCIKLSSLKLGICLNITDEGLAYIGRGCSDLKELDLYRCMGITDSGVMAIASACTGLEMINISYCYVITDSSLISLSKCPRLIAFESRGCPLITSLGLASIVAGCKQLLRLDIKKCYYINDAGMISLARHSQNLRQINLSYTSVTDVGLLSLASVSCLQSMTILHMNGLTPSGLTAAMLACHGLTKVKLQASFKTRLPRSLSEHLEARGCVFHWRDKVYQADLDPKFWKLQLENLGL